MGELIAMLSLPFAARAMVGVVVSVCAALLGVILVQKRYSLIGHGLGDVGFAALSLALALGLPPLTVAIPLVVAAAIAIMFVSQRSGEGGDVTIGMVATGALALGVIVTALSRGFNMDVSSFMFGSIVAMSQTDGYLSLGLGAVVLCTFTLSYNRLFLISYDEGFARALGVNVRFYQFLIALLTALTVVLGMRMMGTLLISGLIIFPAVTARRVAGSFRALILLAALISAICYGAGVLLSFMVNLPTSASIVAVNAAAFCVAAAVGRAMGR